MYSECTQCYIPRDKILLMWKKVRISTQFCDYNTLAVISVCLKHQRKNGTINLHNDEFKLNFEKKLTFITSSSTNTKLNWKEECNVLQTYIVYSSSVSKTNTKRMSLISSQEFEE